MATTIHRSRIADGVQHERLERMLSLHSAVLRTRRHVLRDSQPSGVLDIEERSMEAEEQDVGFWLLELTSQMVQGIETALQRLEAGEFGSCSECQCRIEDARLRALPFAVLCVACQEKHDPIPIAFASRPTAAWRAQVA